MTKMEHPAQSKTPFLDERKEKIDLLVKHFWEEGYSIIKRKFGIYLSDPPKIRRLSKSPIDSSESIDRPSRRVSNYEIDILARKRKDYAIGLCLDSTDLNDSHILEKIRFLATRKTNYSNHPVCLFLGITNEIYNKVRELIYSLDYESRKNIKLFSLSEIKNYDLFTNPSTLEESDRQILVRVRSSRRRSRRTESTDKTLTESYDR